MLSQSVVVSFFIFIALMAVLIWWLKHSKKYKTLDAVAGVGAILFGVLSLWRALRALEDGHISTSRVLTGVFHRASEAQDFWLLTLFFVVFGIAAISIGFMIVVDTLRHSITSSSE
jgi:hypothetical protein